MGLARSLAKIPMILALILLLAVIAGSTWGVLSWLSPMARSGIDMIIAEYDRFAPEVTIANGLASADVEQPYYIDLGAAPGLVMVIDTREGMEDKYMDYLKDAQGGFVLSRDKLITKNNAQYRIVELKDMPNLVINSDSLADLDKQFFPMLVQITAICLAIYFFLSKTIQALLLALIPYIGGGSDSSGVTYGMAFKTTILAMIPPVIVSFLMLFADMRFYAIWLAYVVIFLALLIIFAVLFRQKSGTPVQAGHDAINP